MDQRKPTQAPGDAARPEGKSVADHGLRAAEIVTAAERNMTRRAKTIWITGGIAILFIIGCTATWFVAHEYGRIAGDKAGCASVEYNIRSMPNYAAKLRREFYPVVRVIDGDTIVVKMDGRNTTIRLLGIDAPESVHPRKPVQPYGVEAAIYLRELLAGQQVFVEMLPAAGLADHYGRTLAHIRIATEHGWPGLWVNRQMLAHGYARLAPNPEATRREMQAYWGNGFFSHGRYEDPVCYVRWLYIAEDEARRHGRGLWALEVPSE